MSALAVAAAAVVGYLLGAVSPAALIARARGIDLRGEGSGNPGATNVGRLLGLRWGVLVGVLDVLKGFVPAVLFFTFFGDGAGEVAGAAAVVGHVSSPFLRGRGGRGVATAFGAVLGVAAFWALALMVVFAVVAALSRWVGLASMAAGIALVVIALVTDADTDQRIWAVFLAVVILVRHRTNVVARWRAWRVYG
ncbi:MAG: acyl phosphate:glycerol-3-phosphate acyltransferase [Actinomycetota bacterium]|nr:acyl phosphate:glycerol-3-phosphate acyltransferase [Actinomycetota bacterium]